MSAAKHGELLHIDESRGRQLRAGRPSPPSAERLASQFKALGDPTRLGLAVALRSGAELCVCDLSWVAERPQNLTSHHMKVLKTEGIVSARRNGKMTMYQLTADGLALVDAALERLAEGSP